MVRHTVFGYLSPTPRCVWRPAVGVSTIPRFPRCCHLLLCEAGGGSVTRETYGPRRVGRIQLANLRPWFPVLSGVVVAVIIVTLSWCRLVPLPRSRWDLSVALSCRDCSVEGVSQNWCSSFNGRCDWRGFFYIMCLFWLRYQFCGHGTRLGLGTVVRVDAVGPAAGSSVAMLPTGGFLVWSTSIRL